MKKFSKAWLLPQIKKLYVGTISRTGRKHSNNHIYDMYKAYLNTWCVKYDIPMIKLSDCIPACHISTSNIKTNIPSWSTLPSDDVVRLSNGRKIVDKSFKGTCGGADCSSCKSWALCYAIRMLRYPDVAKNYIENTLLMRESLDKCEKEILKQLYILKPDLFRFDVAGEIETFEQFIMFLSIAYQTPDTTYYVYTKNYDVVDKYFSTGCELPDNFHLLISVWHDSGIECYLKHRHHKNVHAFVYNDGDYDYKAHGLELLESHRCKAYDMDGTMNHEISCRKCGKCYNPKMDIIWTYPH